MFSSLPFKSIPSKGSPSSHKISCSRLMFWSITWITRLPERLIKPQTDRFGPRLSSRFSPRRTAHAFSVLQNAVMDSLGPWAVEGPKVSRQPNHDVIQFYWEGVVLTCDYLPSPQRMTWKGVRKQSRLWQEYRSSDWWNWSCRCLLSSCRLRNLFMSSSQLVELVRWRKEQLGQGWEA